jgi:formylglycine-generating enzyme required for sulfatase activity
MRAVMIFVLSLTVVAATAPTSPSVTLPDLLSRAASYLKVFATVVESVTTDESYVQELTAEYVGLAPSTSHSIVSFGSNRFHRWLRSDFMLVRIPGTADLIPFRDVVEVDGVPIAEHKQRLASLFLTAPNNMIALAHRLKQEGARYNLGTFSTTLGDPLMGLTVLQGTYKNRFRFALGNEDRKVGSGVWIVQYQEVTSPAMIHGDAGRDLFAHGRVWIDAGTGRIVKTELEVAQVPVRAKVSTTFRFDDRFGIALPSQMQEVYTLATGGALLKTAVASYGRFRPLPDALEQANRAFTDSTTGMTFVDIPAGEITLGSVSTETGRAGDEILHEVEIQPFELSRFETTQEEWRTVMHTSPSHFRCPTCPVENVSFDDIQQFLASLNERTASNPHADPPLRYRLPTEAEWEYACHAGTTGPYSTGEALDTHDANINGKSTKGIGRFPLNPWSLADMHGNVAEWTADWYGPYAATKSSIDPHGPAMGTARVIRGGSWSTNASGARCASREAHAPGDRSASIGFRVAADREMVPRATTNK